MVLTVMGLEVKLLDIFLLCAVLIVYVVVGK